MRMEHVFLLVSASLLTPSTHAATTYNLPLLQETLEIIGGDIFTGITKMINGGGALKSLAEGIGYGKKHVYDKSSEQTGGIEDDELDEGQEAEDDALLDEDKPTLGSSEEKTPGTASASNSEGPKDPAGHNNTEGHEGGTGVDSLLKEDNSTTATAGKESIQPSNTGKPKDSKDTKQEEVKEESDKENTTDKKVSIVVSTPVATDADGHKPTSNSDSEDSNESDSEVNEDSQGDVEEDAPQVKITSASSGEDTTRTSDSPSSNESESSDSDNDDDSEEDSQLDSEDKKTHGKLKLSSQEAKEKKPNPSLGDQHLVQSKDTATPKDNGEDIKEKEASADIVQSNPQDSTKVEGVDKPTLENTDRKMEISTKVESTNKIEDQEDQSDTGGRSLKKDKVEEHVTGSSDMEITKRKTGQNGKFIKSFLHPKRYKQKGRKRGKWGGKGHGYLSDNNIDDEEEPSSKDDEDDDDAQTLASAFINIAAQKLLNHFEGIQL